MTRLAIRGYGNRKLLLEHYVEIEQPDDLGPIAVLHAKALASYDDMMVEIEFLDEPNIDERFVRFGTDPSLMVRPFRLDTLN